MTHNDPQSGCVSLQQRAYGAYDETLSTVLSATLPAGYTCDASGLKYSIGQLFCLLSVLL
jgi:hypothetical protein